MASWKVLICGLVLASLAPNSSTSAHRVKRLSDTHLNENFIEINDKFQLMEKKMEQLVSKGNEKFDMRQIIANITRLIIDSNDNIVKKMETFEEKLNKIEKFEENFKSIEENLNKSEKCESKLNKSDLILLQLKNASDHGNKESYDVGGGETSLCNCTCADNATTMSVKGDLKPTDNWNTSVKNKQKAPNPCLINPCLHGSRCWLSSTGSGYMCECPKFRNGVHCENDGCSVENRCWTLNDTRYVIIETRLTWPEAKVKCEGLNMTLAMPKDEERTLFLINQLRPIYTTWPWLWIGLKSDERMSKGQWAWVDGSALGEYTGGNKDMKSETGPLFGGLYLPIDRSYMWDWYYDTYLFYSICETRFFTY